MIPLVINHLMSTCFRGAQDPMDRADQRSNYLAAPANKCAFISGGAENQRRLNIIRTVGIVHFLQASYVT